MKDKSNQQLIQPDRVSRSRRKTIALILEQDGTLEVRAPQQMTDKQILDFVQSKASWIRKRQAAVQAGPPPHSYQQGEEFLYLGKLYPLRYVEKQRITVQFNGKSIDLRTSGLPDAAEWIEGWYRFQAREYLTDRLAHYGRVYGFSYKSLRINGARTRWGSCNAQRGSLNFAWRLVMAPPEIVDYVVVHELCHLRHANHAAAFWAEVEGIMPDYKQRRKWLKDNGVKLRM
ncbi:MAG: SprT family zinc-dependent metalloprotease [Anaerolineaceae bacterium]|jgi:predicted metal-dependent hydrolase|nr:SprT family zinc-dependent metalloprotease [Anaerolineaceae bacterium]